VTEKDKNTGAITTKKVEIVDGNIKINNELVTAGKVGMGLGGYAKYGTNPLNDPFVLALIAYSPTLQDDLNMIKDGWEIKYTDGHSFVDYFNGVVYINKGQNEFGVLKSLAHEVGHVYFPTTFVEEDLLPSEKVAMNVALANFMAAAPGSAQETTAKETYVTTYKQAAVRKALESEGAAVIDNITIQREILASGSNIGVDCGIQPCEERYKAIYEQYLSSGKTPEAYDTARKAIAELRKVELAGTGELYQAYYEREWDEKNKPELLEWLDQEKASGTP
jgi:hypothetical protein